MAFLNMKKVVFKNEYTTQELYEAIKDVQFPLGKPVLAKHGAATLIVFAPINKDTQMVINPGKIGDKINVYRVMVMPEVGLDNLIVSTVIDIVTDQWALVINQLGKNVKEYKKCVDTIADQLDGLGL